MPFSMHNATTPFRMLSSFQTLNLDLHRRDIRYRPRLLDLTDGHVAQANRLDRPIALKGGQRAHAGGERRARSGAWSW